MNKNRVIIGALVLVVLASVFILYFRNNPENPNLEPPLTTDKHQPRQIDGSDWYYVVDKAAEENFDIQVTLQPGSEKNELLISGRGCNNMSATVSSDLDDGWKVKTRKINNIEYSLSQTLSTQMACMDERQNWDKDLQAEIENIFDSLELKSVAN